MAVSVVIGGQYGSEGKGKAAYYWAKKTGASAVVRVGGSNSGHTIYDEQGHRYAFRLLPTACMSDGTVSILPAGSYIDLPVLLSEIRLSGISREKLWIDPNAVIIRDEYKEKEAEYRLRESIGSTLSGTGAAVMARVRRDRNAPVLMAKNAEELRPYLKDTKTHMRRMLEEGKGIVIEGTQGYGLSNYHAKDYPYATGRDTTAAAFLAEAGLSPLDVEHVVMVIRTFPIRVAGDSGPLKEEINWEIVTRESGAANPIEEKTTVTQKTRRVARFDAEIVKEAITANRPDVIVLNHLDYLDYPNKGSSCLTDHQETFVQKIETEIGQRIDYCGNGEMSMISRTGE